LIKHPYSLLKILTFENMEAAFAELINRCSQEID